MTIANIKKGEKYTVYIGRGSIFGNQFRIGLDGTRGEVIAKYEACVQNNDEIMKAIFDLCETDILGCYCSPLPCHGEVIIKLWKEMHMNNGVK